MLAGAARRLVRRLLRALRFRLAHLLARAEPAVARLCEGEGEGGVRRVRGGAEREALGREALGDGEREFRKRRSRTCILAAASCCCCSISRPSSSRREEESAPAFNASPYLDILLATFDFAFPKSRPGERRRGARSCSRQARPITRTVALTASRREPLSCPRLCCHPSTHPTPSTNWPPALFANGFLKSEVWGQGLGFMGFWV